MLNNDESVLLDRDAAHLIHPLHSPAGHASGKVWVGGEGEYLIDANGGRYLDGLSGLWNNTAGHGREDLAAAGFKQMQELAFASGYSGSSNQRAIELGGTARHKDLSEHQPFLLHVGWRGSDGLEHQAGAALLEAYGQAG